MPIDPVALTRQLVDIESITENEAAVGHFLSAYLTNLGFHVEQGPVPHSAGQARLRPVTNDRAVSAERPVVSVSRPVPSGIRTSTG